MIKNTSHIPISSNTTTVVNYDQANQQQDTFGAILNKIKGGAKAITSLASVAAPFVPGGAVLTAAFALGQQVVSKVSEHQAVKVAERTQRVKPRPSIIPVNQMEEDLGAAKMQANLAMLNNLTL